MLKGSVSFLRVAVSALFHATRSTHMDSTVVCDLKNLNNPGMASDLLWR